MVSYASSASAFAAPASITMTSRRRQHSRHQCTSQRCEVSFYVLSPQGFSKANIKINTALPVPGPGYGKPVHFHKSSKTENLPAKSSTDHLIPLHNYLASLFVDHATNYASKKSNYKNICTGHASHDAQLSPCGTETQARFDAEAELEDSVCTGHPEKPVAVSTGVTGPALTQTRRAFFTF